MRNKAKQAKQGAHQFRTKMRNTCETDFVSLYFASKRNIFLSKTGAPYFWSITFSVELPSYVLYTLHHIVYQVLFVICHCLVLQQNCKSFSSLLLVELNHCFVNQISSSPSISLYICYCYCMLSTELCQLIFGLVCAGKSGPC